MCSRHIAGSFAESGHHRINTSDCKLVVGIRLLLQHQLPQPHLHSQKHYPSTQLLLVKLDVTKPQEIKDAFQQAKAAFGRVDVVFNNAGYVVTGEAEAIPDEPARAMFETNFWGAVHVSQEAVRFFRDENSPQGGHLIQNSAAVGIATLPTMGFYSAAKHGERNIKNWIPES